jgi:single-strand DNA-binding protein
MAGGVNKAIIIGHLGADPEVRYTPSGRPVANFRIATTETWNDKQGQRQEHTEWHRIVAWGPLAERCGEYLARGRLAYVEGKLQTRQWEDRDGNKRYTTEIQAFQVTFLGGRNEGAPAQRPSSPAHAIDNGGPPPDNAEFGYGAPPATDDDVPF